MARSRFAAPMLVASLLAGAVAAQEQASAAETPETGGLPKFGVGLQLNPLILGLGGGPVIGANSVLIPVRITPRLVLEPEVWMQRMSQETSGSFVSSDKDSFMSFGLRVLVEGAPIGDFRPYVSPRAGLILLKSESQFGAGAKNTTKQTSKYFGAGIGGQYHFSSHFSLGGEAALIHTLLGDEVDEPTTSDPVEKGSMTVVLGTVVVRVYLR